MIKMLNGLRRKISLKKIVAVSGYFNPLHSGHLNYLREAKKLGHLIVIVNNDKQCNLKGNTFMNEQERVEVIRSLKMVDEVILSLDTDETVCKTLESLRPDIFAKGGDRDENNIPEKRICQKLGIKIISNVGGLKTQSSSNLLYKKWGNK